jgi:hypothetical protein
VELIARSASGNAEEAAGTSKEVQAMHVGRRLASAGIQVSRVKRQPCQAKALHQEGFIQLPHTNWPGVTLLLVVLGQDARFQRGLLVPFPVTLVCT